MDIPISIHLMRMFCVKKMTSSTNRYPGFQYVLISITLLILSCSVMCSAEPAAETAITLPASSTLDIQIYKGKNLVLFFYAIDDPRIDEAVQLMKELYAIRNEYNFDIVGISINPDHPKEVQKYNQNKEIPFPVYLDHNMLLFSKSKMTGGVGYYIFNKQGKCIGSKLGTFTPQSTSLANNWRVYASEYLKIDYIPADEPILGIKPPVALFKGKTIGGSMLDIREVYQDKPTCIVIFSPECNYCQHELAFLNSLYGSGDLQGLFEIVAISIADQPITARFINNQKYSFPVIVDTDRKISSLFPSYTGTIPLSFLVDQTGSIIIQHNGFTEYLRDIYTMELKKLAGLPNRPLLSKDGYSGEMTCLICHEKEHIQWKLTKHADAFASLIRKGEEDNEQCIVCHVTGFGSIGGYKINNKENSKHLEGVQCESCHGAGYQSCSAYTGEKPKKKETAEWEKLCLSCHTQKESINFVFAKRYQRILHTNVADLSKMSREERLQFLRTYRKKRDIFDNPAKYTGASSCKECHSEEYASWEKTLHAKVHKNKKAKAVPPDKLFRYNTGIGSAGGYPEPNREGVQCEACHGPGERHVDKPKAKGQNYIIDLGSECASCVVEQICRRCHSVADDPNFDFQKQLKKVRHKQ